MLINRIMPCLLLKDGGLVKTIRFDKPQYVGDPINAIRIYNEKEVDELIFLDITASLEGKLPNFQLLSEIASECFMPVTYGGGVRNLEDARRIFNLGVEKISLNSYMFEKPEFITEMANVFGSQAVLASIDVKTKPDGRYEVLTLGGKKATGRQAVEFAQYVEKLGAGEILLNSIDRDGTQSGYELELISQVSHAVGIPVIACGGAGSVQDFAKAIKEGGASACAAGSMVVFFGRQRAVLINFPARADIEKALL
jgi:cyclase